MSMMAIDSTCNSIEDTISQHRIRQYGTEGKKAKELYALTAFIRLPRLEVRISSINSLKHESVRIRAWLALSSALC